MTRDTRELLVVCLILGVGDMLHLWSQMMGVIIFVVYLLTKINDVSSRLAAIEKQVKL